MILLHEKIDVQRPVHEAFVYISDFRTAQEWDATAFAASKLTPGKNGRARRPPRAGASGL